MDARNSLLALLLGGPILAALACESAAPCGECPPGQFCYYGSCVPNSDAGDDGARDDAAFEVDGREADGPEDAEARLEADGEAGPDADAEADDADAADEAETCTDGCTLGQRRCNGTAIEACARASGGCLAWQVERDCGTTAQVCDAASGTPECFGGTGDSCADPTVLTTLPHPVTGTSFRTDFGDDVAFTGEGCGAGAGPDAVFVRYLEAGEVLRVRDTAALDLVFRVLSACSPSAACLAYRDDPDTTGLPFVAPAAGNYYFVVEPYSDGSDGPYAISFERPEPGDLCAAPVAADALLVERSGTRFDEDFFDDHAFGGAGCFTAAGAELIFRRELPAGASVRFRDRGGADLVFHVLEACDAAAACLASMDEPDALGLVFTAPAAGTYWFVAEGYGTSEPRDYDVLLNLAGPGDVCATATELTSLPHAAAEADFWDDYGDQLDFTDPSCGAGLGAEAVFVRDMAAGEGLTISETTGLDLVLHVLDDCSAGARCLQAFDDPETPFTTFRAATAGRYYFVLETYAFVPADRAYAIEFAAAP